MDLNKFNLSEFSESDPDLLPHEVVMLVLHVRHVVDFCAAAEKILNRLSPSGHPASGLIASPTLAPSEMHNQNSGSASSSSTLPRSQNGKSYSMDSISGDSLSQPAHHSSAPPIHSSAGKGREDPPPALSSRSASGPSYSSSSYPHSNVLAASSSSSQPASVNLSTIEDRVFQAGKEYTAQTDMDINIRRGDRIKVATLMDDGMTLGTNLETGATGTFPLSCVTQGTLMSRVEEQKREAALAEVAAVVEVVEAAAAADLALVLEDGTMVMDEIDWPVRTERPRAWSTPGTHQEHAVAGGPSGATPSGRRMGLHLVTKAYDSKSVLEASLAVDDLVHVLFWQDDEIAVGIHLRTQSESLFQGSLLRYIGSNADLPSSSLAPASHLPSMSPAPHHAAIPGHIPGGIAYPRQPRGSAPPLMRVSLRGDAADAVEQQHDDEAGAGVGGETNYDEAQMYSTALVVDQSKSWFANVIEFQKDDADRYKEYLEGLERTASRGEAHRSRRPSGGQIYGIGAMPGAMPPLPLPGAMTDGTGGVIAAPPRRSSAWIQPAQSTTAFAPSAAPLLQPQGAAAAASAAPPPLPSKDPATMTEQEGRALAARFVIEEFHSTEEKFLRQLRIFKEYVIEPIYEGHLLSEMDFDIAFKRCEPILALSSRVEVHLRDAKSRDPTAVVELFLNNIEHEDWKVYEDYIRYYRSGKQVIATMEAQQGPSGDAFRQFVYQLERVEAVNRMNIYDFMMLPIQRITRYWLLLERLRKYTEPGSLLYENIKIAEDYMREIGNTLQRIQAKEDGIRAMFQIVNT
ncbi:LD03170p, partial [Cladochytrium tenue]